MGEEISTETWMVPLPDYIIINNETCIRTIVENIQLDNIYIRAARYVVNTSSFSKYIIDFVFEKRTLYKKRKTSSNKLYFPHTAISIVMVTAYILIITYQILVQV